MIFKDKLYDGNSNFDEDLDERIRADKGFLNSLRERENSLIQPFESKNQILEGRSVIISRIRRPDGVTNFL